MQPLNRSSIVVDNDTYPFCVLTPVGVTNEFDLYIARLPIGVVAFGQTGGGSVFCLDYRSTSAEPSVIFFRYDVGDLDGALKFLAADIDEFFEHLIELPNEDSYPPDHNWNF